MTQTDDEKLNRILVKAMDATEYYCNGSDLGIDEEIAPTHRAILTKVLLATVFGSLVKELGLFKAVLTLFDVFRSVPKLVQAWKEF